MRVIYQFQESKTGRADGGEDRLVITPDFIAVIDGATSKSGKNFDGKTSGGLAADAIAVAIQSLPQTVDAFAAVAHMSQAVQEHVINRFTPEMNDAKYLGDRPNASVVIFSKHHSQVWRIGDGHFKIGKGPADLGKKEIDLIVSKLRADYIHAMLLRGSATIEELMAKDLGREIILPALTALPLLMNISEAALGYGVIDGRPVPKKFIEIHPVNDADRIMLASDGVLEDLHHSDDLEINMDQVLLSQQAYYGQDPLLIGRHKSTKGLVNGQKWHDDVTIVDFMIS